MESQRPLALFIYNASWNRYEWVRDVARKKRRPNSTSSVARAQILKP